MRVAVILLLLLSTGAPVRSQDIVSDGGRPVDPVIYSEIAPTSAGLPYDLATDTREQFPAPNGQVVEVLVKGPAGQGTYSRPMAPGETPDAYFPAVVQEAINAKAHHLVIPQAAYTFQEPTLCEDLKSSACNQPTSCNINQYWNCAPHWTIGAYPSSAVSTPNAITDLDIDFSGSVLNFRAPVIGIWILEAQRLRLRNLTVDWPELPVASLGTIVADPVNPGHNALVIDNGYPVTDQYNGGTIQIQAVDPWDDLQGAGAPGMFDAKSNNTYEVYFIFNNPPQPTYVGKTSAGDQTFSCESCNFVNSPQDSSCSFFNGCANFDGFPVGSRVIVRHYTYNGIAFLINWCDDLDFENVHLLTGPGIGFGVNGGGVRGFRFYNSTIDRAPGRLISTASDGIDVELKGDTIIEDSRIAHQGDDAINIHPTLSPVTSVLGANVGVSSICDADTLDNPVPGDALVFFDQNATYIGTGHVRADIGDCTNLTVTLDKEIPGLNASGMFVDFTQQATPRYIVQNNIFEANRGHGVVVNTPYGWINQNTYENNSAGAIAGSGGNAYGPGAANLVIANNTVRSPGQSTEITGAISFIATTLAGLITTAPIFEKLNLSSNVIDTVPGPAFVITSARYMTIGPTQIQNVNQVQNSGNIYGSTSTNDSIVVDQSAYINVCGTQLGGATTGPIGLDPSDSQSSVTPSCTPPPPPSPSDRFLASR